MTRAKQRREQNDEKMYSIPEEKGLVKINVDSESISLPFMKTEGKIALELKTTVDLPKAFGLIRNERHCEHCGKIFPCGDKCQTLLCSSCYSKDLISRNISSKNKCRKQVLKSKNVLA